MSRYGDDDTLDQPWDDKPVDAADVPADGQSWEERRRELDQIHQRSLDFWAIQQGLRQWPDDPSERALHNLSDIVQTFEEALLDCVTVADANALLSRLRLAERWIMDLAGRCADKSDKLQKGPGLF